MNPGASRIESKEAFLEVVREIGTQAGELRSRLEGEFEPDPKAIRHASRMAEAAAGLFLAAEGTLSAEGFQPASSDEAGHFRQVRHDLRNRLNHLTGPAQLLRRQLKAARWQPALDRLQERLDACLLAIDQYGIQETGYLQVLDSSVEERVESEDAAEAVLEPRLLRSAVEPASILVADDEAEIRDFLAEVLSGEGHEITQAEDGETALRLAQEGDFDLVLLDLGLPKLTGFEVLERLEAAGQLHHLPVIVVTGRRKVQDAVRCIEHGADDFLTKPVQLELLHARVNSCLERKRLREAEFKQFFPPQLAREFARHPDLRDMEGKFADVSLLFCDIRGFSTITERLGPRETVRWLRAVMGDLSGCVIDNGGVLVDYAGDELLAMWGAPSEIPDHAERACATALEMMERIPRLNEVWSSVIGAQTDFGIGINSGRALVGNIGTDRKFKYGPLGNTVNLASRVQGVTKRLQTNLLVTGATRDALPQQTFGGRMRRVCKVRVINIDEPVHLYEVAVDPGPSWTQLRDQYERALASFEAGQIREATALLGAVLAHHPTDGPTFQLLNRIADAKTNPGRAVDAVWTLQGK